MTLMRLIGMDLKEAHNHIDDRFDYGYGITVKKMVFLLIESFILIMTFVGESK